MPEPTTNTEKIKALLKKHPVSLAAWTSAIEEQNETTIRHAWRTTLKDLLPSGTIRMVGTTYQKVIQAMQGPKIKGLSLGRRKILLEIATILQRLKIGKFKFGDDLELGSRTCLYKEGVIFVCVLYAHMTKELNGFHFVIKEDNYHEAQAFYQDTPLSEFEAAELLKEKEHWGIIEAGSFVDVFTFSLLIDHPYLDLIGEVTIGYDQYDEMFHGNWSEFSYQLNDILSYFEVLDTPGKDILITPLAWDRETIQEFIPWEIPYENWILRFPEQATQPASV